VDTARLEEMTRNFYRNGWRLLKPTIRCGDASEPDHGLRRAIENSRLGRKCQLRVADTATNAPQSEGVEGDQPRSKDQNDEGALPASSA
jgi:hypothetical protein